MAPLQTLYAFILAWGFTFLPLAAHAQGQKSDITAFKKPTPYRFSTPPQHLSAGEIRRRAQIEQLRRTYIEQMRGSGEQGKRAVVSDAQHEDEFSKALDWWDRYNKGSKLIKKALGVEQGTGTRGRSFAAFNEISERTYLVAGVVYYMWRYMQSSRTNTRATVDLPKRATRDASKNAITTK